VDCVTTSKTDWRCTRSSTVPAWNLLGIADDDPLLAADAVRVLEKPHSERRNGRAYEIQRRDTSTFRLPMQRSMEEAERDREAFLAFVHTHQAELHLKSPAPSRNIFEACFVTAIFLLGTAWNVPRWWRGDDRTRRDRRQTPPAPGRLR
jgi:hypothetical protein